jgi:hypothetical protein
MRVYEPAEWVAPGTRYACRYRAVAQSGSALVWGTRGRRFKSAQPDHTPGVLRGGHHKCLGVPPPILGGFLTPKALRRRLF